MPGIIIIAKKDPIDVTCGVPFKVELEVSVKNNSSVIICFEIKSKKCFFTPGKEMKKCEDPFEISPSDGGVPKPYDLTLNCDPADRKYVRRLYVTAIDRNTGESVKARISLNIDCRIRS